MDMLSRMDLTEHNILNVINPIDNNTESVFYPVVLAITLKGKPKDIREILEKLVQKGILRKHKSKIPFAHKIFGYGYYKPK